MNKQPNYLKGNHLKFNYVQYIQASCTMGTGSFPGVKRLGRGAHHPPHSSVEVKKEYSYTSTPPPPIPFWAYGSVTGYLYIYSRPTFCASCSLLF
jgi:hypothetical protein